MSASPSLGVVTDKVQFAQAQAMLSGKKSIQTLLLVEDNPGDARLLREMLNDGQSQAIEVTHVQSMAEAEKHLAWHSVDIILLDLGLPDAKGLEVVRRARAAASRVPLVVLTGLDDESLAVQALQEGAQDYLVKGQIEARGLLRALRYAVERKMMEEQHRSLMEHANDAILLLEPGLRILEANRRAEELLGCPREKIVGASYESFIAPEDRSLLAADGATLLAEGATQVQDRRLLRTDGAVVPVDISSSLIRLVDETVVLSILHDTSKRKQAERELGAAQDRLRHVVSSSPAVLYTLAVVGRTLTPGWVSDNIEQVIGYRSDEASAAGWWRAHVHPEDLGRLLAQDSEVLGTGHIEREYRLRGKDGVYRWLRDEQKLLRDDAGNPIEVIGSWSDVTVRKGAQQRLQESAEEYRLLFDSNPHPMWVFDNETLAFLAVNDAAVQLYGFSRQEFLGMTIKDIRPPEEIASLLAAHARIADTPGSLRATEVKHCRKDGTRLEVEGASNAIEFHGRRARLVLAIDVTEKRGLEAQLVQAQKMEAVGRLAGGVAHDFNNLLGVITGYSELLLKNLGRQHPGSKRVEQILRAALRAAGLTRQLLAFSRKQVLQPRVLDLNDVVADVETMLRRVIGEDIEFVTTRGAGLSRIRADPGQIEQVLMNLAVNARDAMPKGGKLVIETADVVLDDTWSRARAKRQGDHFVMLSVNDSGEGMSAETQSHIFEPFFTTKEEGKGTGLGLATVFGIVEQSGATIKVSSRLGAGTTFKIYFPIAEGDLPAPLPPPAGGPSPRGSETILVVEDADSLRVIVREILEDAGYQVIDSSDPEEALLRASALPAPIHLLLTDVVMPRMSGPDLSKAVRVARPAVKVLFMSGYTGEAMGLHGVLAEGVQFIQKPFTPDELVSKVRASLDAA